ncbi:MAG TPA: choline/carnitine O-acyltransferase, partial [Myxococcota bacterium]|nr:choline/carnitine O-acyltransferase [Myxococcota bacterium]
MSAPETDSFPTYAALQDWLLEELGEVPVQTLLKYGPPASVGDLSGLPRAEANRRLKHLFMDTFVPREDYDRQVDYLASLMPRETRTKINSPLPSTDFCILLTSTPGLNWLERASRLCCAATDLHQQFMRGNRSTRALDSTVRQSHLYDNIFGASVVPGPSEHAIVLAKESRFCNVLFRGHAFCLPLIHEDGSTRPVEELYSDLKHLVDQDLPKGRLGLLRTLPLREVFDLNQQLDPAALDQLAAALFTLCLDERAPGESGALNARATALFSGNRHNRWYGTFQVVVCNDAEAGLLFSYMCGVEGAQASEFVEELVYRSHHYPWRESAFAAAIPTPLQRIPLELPPAMAEQVEKRAAPLFHPSPSIFVLSRGLSFFRRLRLSPNVTIQAVLMMAIAEVGGLKHLPETSQAVRVRESCTYGVQLD